MKKLIFPLLFCINLFASNHIENAVTSWKTKLNTAHTVEQKKQLLKTSDTFYDYLNTLRTATGLNILTYNSLLEQSSLNHANYIVTNQIVGHYEDSSKSGFTGVQPTNRAFYVGFNSSISENLSVGQDDYKESIDDLFGAIYHRFGFLDFGIDLVGIGNSGSDNLNTFVYNMGNSELELLCQGTGFTGFGQYYTNVCKDTNKKIEATAYENTKKIQNPNYIIWPYPNYNNTPPVFFEESPDPLPNQGVSGYPVSIQFNENYYTQGINLISFELFDKDMQEITNVSLIDENTDVNSNFTSNQFTLFPLDRLKWGSIYHAKVVFENLSTNQSDTIEWSFKTQSLDYDYFIITENSKSLNLIPNKTYVIYMKPQNNNEYSNGYSSSYLSGVNPQISYLDLNTLIINFDGNINQTASINFINGRSLNITLSSSDDAISKDTQDKDLNTTTTEPTNDGFDYELESLSSGWHLMGAVEDISDLSIFDDIAIVWTYKDNSWYVYSANTATSQTILNSNFKDTIIETINQGEGFWIYK